MIFFDDIEVSISKEYIIIESKKPIKVLSSAPINGGLRFSNKIINLWIPEDFYYDPIAYYKSKNVDSNAICLMTGADLMKAGIAKKESSNIKVLAIVTAGISNALSITDWNIMRKTKIPNIGTINIIVIVDREMTESCMVNAITTITEAKCKVLSSFDIRSFISYEQATGTSSDALAIASLGKGNAIEYAGSATELGWLIASCVEDALNNALICNNIKTERKLLLRLKERGILLEDLISTAMEIYVPHPNYSKEEAKEIFKRILLEVMDDINVSSLVIAGLRLNEDGERGLIPNMSAENYKKDPVNLVADEILGISIAMYIAGYNGLFEFYRFDRKKPGILKNLPPFIDDVIGGLLAGVSSKMYSYMIEERKK
ncbi:MAG: alpha-ribazole phosphatase CobZ [Candidatus Verstraetearchaeota archaeon]|jgi:alpha-ribazole phosphatase CobZ|nr:alpha-ribazole phosphatase CobZ [Candidatus Verstraetearchaeota archaeon]